MNALNPNVMAANERLGEIAEILALGLQRLLVRQSSDQSADRGESSLHSAADQSGHAKSLPEELDA